MDKEVFGQPLWLWATGAVVVIGGYLYFRSHSASTPATSGSGTGTAPDTSQSSFKEWIKQHNGPPQPVDPPVGPPPPPKPPKKHHKAGS